MLSGAPSKVEVRRSMLQMYAHNACTLKAKLIDAFRAALHGSLAHLQQDVAVHGPKVQG